MAFTPFRPGQQSTQIQVIELQQTLLGALSGLLRLANGTWLTARNAANTADVNIARVNASNAVELGPLATLNISNAAWITGRNVANTGNVNLIGAASDDFCGISTPLKVSQYPASTFTALELSSNLSGGRSEINIWNANVADAGTYGGFEWWQKIASPGNVGSSRKLASLDSIGHFTVNGALTATTVAISSGFGCNGFAPQGVHAVPQPATDLATALVLLNQIRHALCVNGITG